MSLQKILHELYNLKLRQPSLSFIENVGNSGTIIAVGYTQVLEPTDVNILDIKRSKKVAIHNAVKRALQNCNASESKLILLDVDVIVVEGNFPIPNTAYMQLIFQCE